MVNSYELAAAVVSLLAGLVAVGRVMVTAQAKAMDHILSQRAAADSADRQLVTGLVEKLSDNHVRHMEDITQALRDLKEGMAAERQVLELMAQKVLVHGSGGPAPRVRKRPSRGILKRRGAR